MSWQPDPPSTVHLVPDHDATRAEAFSLWNLPGRKTLLHDGGRLLLANMHPGKRVSLALRDGVADGLPFSFAIPANARLKTAMRSLPATYLALAQRTQEVQRRLQRPSRAAIFHARALQALDGKQAGASQREIAIELFGESRVRREWEPSSDLRAQVRHLIQRASALADGAYLTLLKQGDRQRPTESPSRAR